MSLIKKSVVFVGFVVLAMSFMPMETAQAQVRVWAPFYYGGHVSGYTCHKTGVMDAFEIVMNLVELACFEQPVGDFPVVSYSYSAGIDDFFNIRGLGIDGNVMHLAAFIDKTFV